MGGHAPGTFSSPGATTPDLRQSRRTESESGAAQGAKGEVSWGTGMAGAALRLLEREGCLVHGQAALPACRHAGRGQLSGHSRVASAL